MSILFVPSRHLGDVGGGHPWALGVLPPRPKARWTFGGLGQCTDPDTGDPISCGDTPDTPVDLFTGAPNPLYGDLTVTTQPTLYGPAASAVSSTGGCGTGTVAVGSNCYDPSNPLNSLVLSNGQVLQGGAGQSASAWAAAIQSAIQTAGKVATVAVAPPGSSISPTGQVTLAQSAAQIAASVSVYMPLILIAGGLVLVLAMAGKGKG